MPYATVDDVRCEGFPEKRYSTARITGKILLAQQMIEKLTGRFFEPRDLTFRETWNGRDAILFWQPIIRLEEMRFVNTDKTLQEPMDIGDFEVFNRHVQSGLLDKDDRESPKVALLFVRPTSIIPRTKPSTVKEVIQNRTLNIRFKGKFGYTDPVFEAGRTIATDPLDSITAPDLIHMENGAFTDEDKGREITPSGSASNDAIFVIDTVVGPKDITVVEQTLVTEGAGFAADVSAFPQFGVTPLMIKEATIGLATRMLDPLATVDPVAQAIRSGRVRAMTVRDQSIKMDSDPRITSQGGGSLTGDPTIDQLILPFIRPPRMASA